MRFGSRSNQQLSFQMQSSESNSETEQNLKTDRLRIYNQTQQFIRELLSQKSDLVNPFEMLNRHFKQKNQEIQRLKRQLATYRQRKSQANQAGQNKQAKATKNVIQQIPVSQSSGSHSLSYSSSEDRKKFQQYKRRKQELNKERDQLDAMQKNYYLSTMSYISSLLQKNTSKIIVEKSQWQKMVNFYYSNESKVSKFQPVKQPVDLINIKDLEGNSEKKLKAICQFLGYSDIFKEFQSSIRMSAKKEVQKLNKIKNMKVSFQNSDFSLSQSSIDQASFLKKLKQIFLLTQPSVIQKDYFENNYEKNLVNKMSENILQTTSKSFLKEIQSRQNKKYNQFFQKLWTKFFNQLQKLLERNARGKIWSRIPQISDRFKQHIQNDQFDQLYELLDKELQNTMSKIQRNMIPYSIEKTYYIYSNKIKV